ncbi:MAG: hypothetical protein J6K89_07915 [Oscillospiraceae bacterium]|nr:hypothetical protein [Oscillospiraceae bacterium]
MQHRKMIIDCFDTWEHGRFTMTAFSAPTARPRQILQTVPGYDGDLDLSDLPLGRPAYESRTVKATFECSRGSREERQRIFDRLIAQVNGRQVKISDPDHPKSYFYGRVYITQDFNRPSYGQLQLEAVCDPWRYSSALSCELVKIQTPSDNLLLGATVTYLEDLSTASSKTADTETIGSFTSSGDIGRISMWMIELEPNTSYFVSSRIRDGRGTWGCATKAEAEEWTIGGIRTDDTGLVFLRMLSYSTDWLVLYPFVILRAADIPLIDNGATPAKASLDLTAPFPGATMFLLSYGTTGALNNVYNGSITLQPGRQPLVFYSWGAPEAPVPVSWRRGDF